MTFFLVIITSFYNPIPISCALYTPYIHTHMLFSRFYTLLCALVTVHTAYTIYFFLIHHCTNSLSSLHIFVHHCTLKQALLWFAFYTTIVAVLTRNQFVTSNVKFQTKTDVGEYRTIVSRGGKRAVGAPAKKMVPHH